MFEIHTDFEGANCKVLSLSETEAEIEVELRDTVGDWFFWCFKVTGAEGQTVTFRFPSQDRVGYFGAAVSYDRLHWHWQHDTTGHEGGAFTHHFAEDEGEVYFAHDMVYRPERFAAFAKAQGLPIRQLCLSEKGRSVPYVAFGEGEETILLTARHHACESTGNDVLEGVLAELQKGLARRFRILCVPFVDLDGVVEGDQGKQRNNHDHNRDYDEAESAWYAATAAIRALQATERVRFAFDFHSPWHIYWQNDTCFIPFHQHRALPRLQRFSALWQAENTADALPHFSKDDVLPDVDWNRSDTPCFAHYWGEHGAELAFTVETPYFLATDVAFSPERARNTGRNFVRGLEKYLAEAGE